MLKNKSKKIGKRILSVLAASTVIFGQMSLPVQFDAVAVPKQEIRVEQVKTEDYSIPPEAGPAAGDVYDTKGLDPYDSPVKAIVSLSRISIPRNVALENPVQKISLTVEGAHKKYANTGFQIQWEPRLDIYREIDQNGNLSVKTFYEDTVYDRGMGLIDFNESENILTLQTVMGKSFEYDLGAYPATCYPPEFTSDGKLWEFAVVIPDDCKVGDKYPIEIVHRELKNDFWYFADHFSNIENDEEGYLMSAWVFTHGIVQGYVEITEDDPNYIQTDTTAAATTTTTTTTTTTSTTTTTTTTTTTVTRAAPKCGYCGKEILDGRYFNGSIFGIICFECSELHLSVTTSTLTTTTITTTTTVTVPMDSIVWEVEKVTAYPGQDVVVNVKVKDPCYNHLAIAGAEFNMVAGNGASLVKAGNKSAYGADIRLNEDILKFMFISGTGKGYVAHDGSAVVELTYKVDANATPGTIIPISIADMFITDEDGFDITNLVLAVDGSITVVEPDETTSTTDKTTVSTEEPIETTVVTSYDETISTMTTTAIPTTNNVTTNKTTTISFILPSKDLVCTRAYSWESDQPVFDEQGHYRGTNALWSVSFLTTATSIYESETVIRTDIDYPTNGIVDLSNIRVYCDVRYRFGEWIDDVSNGLYVDDYGFLEDETFYVDLKAPYSTYGGGYNPNIPKPLRILIPKPADTTDPPVTTITTVSTTETISSHVTTETTAVASTVTVSESMVTTTVDLPQTGNNSAKTAAAATCAAALVISGEIAVYLSVKRKDDE